MKHLVYHIEMKPLLLILFLTILSAFTPPAVGEENRSPFRMSISTEPLSLDPSQQKGSGTMYLTNALHWPLFLSDIKTPFQPGVLNSCRWKTKKELSCSLTKNIQWSNGQPIVAGDIKKTFEYFMDPKTQTQRKDLVDNIRSIKTPTPQSVHFELINEEPRFQERLTSPLLAPLYSLTIPKPEAGETLVTSGPYTIDKWELKHKVVLRPNAHFAGHPARPFIEIYFIAEDTTALTLYQSGKLDFIRRLPTAFLKAYQNTPDLHLAPITRFDYLGFGPSLAQEPELRKILSRSLNYEEWKIILSARGRPGCFGIALDLIKSDPCIPFDETQVSLWKEQLKTKALPKLEIYYSTLGGEDHKRSVEWLQSEWKKRLGITVTVQGLENSLFQKQILENPPSMFRYGVPLDHLSCANALKQLNRNPNRPLPFKNDSFLRFAKQLAHQKPKQSEEALCTQALRTLIDESWLIPLGRIHFSLLAKPQWKGWRLTALNVLDLSRLHHEK